jgi:hypothetical protein
MKPMLKITASLASVMLLAACVSATPYRAAENKDDYGYQEQKLEENRYRVSFAGNSQTDRQTVENYLLYRAAELTVANGKDYFVVTSSDTEKNVGQHSTVVRPSFSFGYGHHHGYGRHHGFGLGFNVISSSYRDYEAFGVILLKSGQKPSDNENAYDAHSVLQVLGTEVVGQALRNLASTSEEQVPEEQVPEE